MNTFSNIILQVKWESVAQTATGSLEGLSDVSTQVSVNGSILVYNSNSDLFERLPN